MATWEDLDNESESEEEEAEDEAKIAMALVATQVYSNLTRSELVDSIKELLSLYESQAVVHVRREKVL